VISKAALPQQTPFFQARYAPAWFSTILLTQVCAEFHAIRFFITLSCLSTVVWVLQNISISYRQWKVKTLVSA